MHRLAAMRSHRPTAPIVINLIALSIVLGGQAIALQGERRVTRNDIAAGAVTARSLAPGAVTKRKLGRRAVTDVDIASRAVIGRTIKPRSVDGFALAGTFSPVAGIADADPVGDGGDFAWTSSQSAGATCPAGSTLLNGGVRTQDSGFHRAFVQSSFPSSSNASTWLGQISTDTGGASPALLYALCLR